MPRAPRACSTAGCQQSANEQHRLAQETSAGADRNYYFCDRCWGQFTAPCALCNNRIRRRGPTTYNIMTELVNQVLRTLNRPLLDIGQNYSAVACRRCYEQYMWRCQSCHYTFVRSVHPEEEDHTCIACKGQQLPCVRCQKKLNTRTDRMSSANTRYGDYLAQGLIVCPDCVARPEVSKTFVHNKSQRTVGYEIEMVVPVRAMDKMKDLYKYGVVHGDSSISIAPRDTDPEDYFEEDESGEMTAAQRSSRPRGERGAWEFVSYPANGDYLLDSIDIVSAILKKYRCFTNSSCGLHVHLGMKNESNVQRANLIRWWAEMEQLFLLMVKPERRENNFCRPGISHSDRYRALNTTAFSKHGTFEVRLHHGWEDGETLKGWVQTLLNFFDTFTKIEYKAPNFPSARERAMFLFRTCKLPLQLRRYIVTALKSYTGTKRLRQGHFRKQQVTRTHGQQHQQQINNDAYRQAVAAAIEQSWMTSQASHYNVWTNQVLRPTRRG